jgi:hypothetical protein
MPVFHWDDGTSRWNQGGIVWDFATEASQTQAVSIRLQLVRALGPLTQAQSVSLPKQPRLVRAVAQAQSLALSKQPRLVREVSQGQALAITLQRVYLRTLATLSQAQALQVALQKVYLRTLSASQAETLSLSRQLRLGLTLAQTETLSVATPRALLRTVSATQAQTLSLLKQLRFARSISQAQSALSITLQRVFLRVVSAVQPQALSLTKQVRVGVGITVAQALGELGRVVALVRSTTQTQAATRVSNLILHRTVSLGQTQSATRTFIYNPGTQVYPITVSTTQTQAVSAPKQIRISIFAGAVHTFSWNDGSVWNDDASWDFGRPGPMETLTVRQALGLSRSSTQAQQTSIGRGFQIARATTQAQALSISSAPVMARILSIAQTQAVALRQALSLSRPLTFLQDQLATLRSRVGLLRGTTQPQTISISATKVYLLTRACSVPPQSVSVSTAHIAPAVFWNTSVRQFVINPPAVRGPFDQPVYWDATNHWFSLVGAGSLPPVTWTGAGGYFKTGPLPFHWNDPAVHWNDGHTWEPSS